MRAPTAVPLPQPDAASAPFWAGCAERRLLVQHCRACGAYQNAPRLYCMQCRERDFGWRESAGRGRIFTYTVAHHPASAELREQVPYVIVVVELDDCDRVLMLSNLVGAGSPQPEIGAAVRVTWDADAGACLPRFVLTETTRSTA